MLKADQLSDICRKRELNFESLCGKVCLKAGVRWIRMSFQFREGNSAAQHILVKANFTAERANCESLLNFACRGQAFPPNGAFSCSTVFRTWKEPTLNTLTVTILHDLSPRKRVVLKSAGKTILLGDLELTCCIL